MSVRENLSVVASDIVAMLRTRVELFSAEVAEQKHRLFTMAAMLLAAALFLLLAIVVASFLVVAFFWTTEYRYWAIGLLSLAYAATGLMLIWSVCRRVKAEPAPFTATLEELHRDLVVLGQLRESFVEGVRDQWTSEGTTTETSAQTSAGTSTGTSSDHQRRGHHE
jgi:uncharacterized membrane protein YqjE